MKYFLRFYLLIVICLFSTQSLALESDWKSTPQQEGSARLITAGYISDNEILAGIEMKFKPGWHTYWKVPGDSGIPVSADFKESENIGNAELEWPAPTRKAVYDIEGWGYGEHVILPVIIKVKDGAQPVKIDLHMKWAVCEESCLFADDRMNLEIAPGFKDESVLAEIKKYQAEVPEVFSEKSAIRLDNANISEKNVFAVFKSDEMIDKNDVDLFLFEDSKNFRFPKPVVALRDNGREFIIVTTYETLKKDEKLKGKKLNMVLTYKHKAYETSVDIEKIVPQKEMDDYLSAASIYVKDLASVNMPVMEAAPEIEKKDVIPAIPHVSLFQALIAALLGGLILNVMPCVLPVLSLKIFGLIKHGRQDKRFMRTSFVYTIAGIISSFMLIAVFVLILKSLGNQVGWGVQFQHPGFLIFLSMLLTLFAANQWGLFEIILPHKLSDRINLKIDSAGGSSKLGNFLTGAFATLLATPCTAPYLATAVTFAFTTSAITMLLVFAFMGIGLAMPYIVLLMVPSLVKYLPKPGRWMKAVRIILGVFLFITNFWIFLIFYHNGGPNAAFLLLVCSILIMIWLAISHKFKLDKVRTLFTTIYMIIVTFGVTLYLSNIEVEPEFMKGAWVKFNEEKISDYVEKGRVVYVDVTADWCLTCQFNKAHVIYPMKKYLDDEKIVLMKADYTNPDRLISAYLEKNRVYGIPFNKVYGPNAKDGIVLPVILKENDVKEAIEKAK